MGILVDKLQRYFRKSKGSMLGIDIGTSTIKLVELVYNKNRMVLRNAVIVDIPAGLMEDGYVTDEMALGELLQNAIVVNGIQATTAAVTISGRSVFMRELSFPAMTTEELKEAIKWDTGKYVPFAPNTYYYDFSVVAKDEEAMKMKVLLVAAPQALLDCMLGGIKRAGLQVLTIDIEPLAIYHSLTEAKNSMVVDIGGSAAQVIIFQNGSPNVTRAIPTNGERFTRTIMDIFSLDFAEAEKWKHKRILQNDAEEALRLQNELAALIKELAGEIRRTIEYFQVQNKYATVEKIFLTGGGARLPNLAAELSAELNTTVLLPDPSRKIAIDNSLDARQWRDMAPQFSVAIGLALTMAADNVINLLPKAERASDSLAKTALVAAGLFAACAMCGVYGYGVVQSWSITRDVTQLNSRIEELAVVQKKMESAKQAEVIINKKQKIFDDLRQKRVLWHDFIADLGTLTPKNVWLNEFNYAEKSVKISGGAVSYSDLAFFIQQLENDRRIIEPMLDSAEKDKQQDKVNFSILVKTREKAQ